MDGRANPLMDRKVVGVSGYLFVYLSIYLDLSIYLSISLYIYIYGVKFGTNETKYLMTIDQRPTDRCHTETYFATDPMRPWSIKTLLLGSNVSDVTVVRQDG